MKILVVEDEARLADYLRKGLSESGYVVGVHLFQLVVLTALRAKASLPL